MGSPTPPLSRTGSNAFFPETATLSSMLQSPAGDPSGAASPSLTTYLNQSKRTHQPSRRSAVLRHIGLPADGLTDPPLLALLNRLRDTAKQLIGLINASGAPPTPGGTPPAFNDNAEMKVTIGTGDQAKEHRLEAKTITIADNDKQDQLSRYVAGRMPAFTTRAASPASARFQPMLEHEKVLTQAIESGQGLYQFVWPKTHQRDPKSRETSIYETLRLAVDQAEKDNTVFSIGGRYDIEHCEKVRGKELAEGDDYFHYQLTVVDPSTNHRFTVPMTQAAPPMVNGRLEADQIIRSHEILESHHTLLSPEQRLIRPVQRPFIMSNKGRIRNATLIAFTSVYKRIYDLSLETPAQIDDALHDAITAGYEARGTDNFIPSTTQIAMLRSALMKKFATRPTGAQAAPEDRAAMNAAMIPVGPRTEKAMGFDRYSFRLRDNNGGGNCLFHALGGSINEPSLADGGAALRKEVADYLRHRTDKQEDMRNNWHSMSYTLLHESQRRYARFLEKYPAGVAMAVTNREFADFIEERISGNSNHNAGNDEIQLWVDLPRNRGKTVTMVDGDRHHESLTTFRHQQRPTIISINDIAGNESDVRSQIQLAIAPAMADEREAVQRARAGQTTNQPNHLAIYRDVAHFERIERQRTRSEHIDALERVRKFKKLKEQSKPKPAKNIGPLDSKVQPPKSEAKSSTSTFGSVGAAINAGLDTVASAAANMKSKIASRMTQQTAPTSGSQSRSGSAQNPVLSSAPSLTPDTATATTVLPVASQAASRAGSKAAPQTAPPVAPEVNTDNTASNVVVPT